MIASELIEITEHLPQGLTLKFGRIKKEACTVMLDKYLESSPTITEKLAFDQSNGSKTSITGKKMEKKKEIRKTLDSWQESWEKAE